MQESKKIAIVGSGLVGTLLAIYLKKAGHSVHVFDRRADLRKVAFSGRSINLAISNRGWNALREVGIEQDIKTLAIPMDKRAIHMPNEEVGFQEYGKKGEAIYSIPRGLLNQKMISLAEEVGVDFHFQEKIWDVDLKKATLFSGKEEEGPWEQYDFDLVFGADGAFSRLRHKMQRQSRFDYSQKFLKVAYKELKIEAREDGTHKLDKNSFHIWPRGKFMLIAMPNHDGSFTCTLFMPFEGENSFETVNSEAKAEVFFNHYFSDITAEIENLTHDFFTNPTSALVSISCFPWTYKDKVALIGDAAHAVVPFYGQGMNAGFEDIFVLNTLMQKYEDNWEKIFQEYQSKRKPNADAIEELSFRNFVEMSSKTADENFLLRKKIEKYFAQKYPEKWIPLYSRVTFSDKAYSEAIELGDRQDAIMDEVMKMDAIQKKWESGEVEQKILSLLESKA